MTYRWIACPKCGKAHFLKVCRETKLLHYPAYCKSCKAEVLVSYNMNTKLEPMSQNS